MKDNRNQLAPRDPFDFDFFGIAPFSLGFPKGFIVPSAKMTCDVKETEDAYMVEAEFPGIAKEDIDISFDDDVLTISCEHKEEKEEGGESASYLIRERSFSSYKRSFRLPDVDVEKTKASLEDGVLTVELPKKEKEETKTSIDIA